MRHSSRLELGPLESQVLTAALDLSGAEPDLLVLVNELAERTGRSDTAVMWAILMLERKGLLEFNVAADGVFATTEACRWAGVLQTRWAQERSTLN